MGIGHNDVAFQHIFNLQGGPNNLAFRRQKSSDSIKPFLRASVPPGAGPTQVTNHPNRNKRQHLPQSLLQEKADLDWLFTTHLNQSKLRAKTVAAFIYGNEDAPSRVELFDRDDYRAKPFITVLIAEDL